MMQESVLVRENKSAEGMRNRVLKWWDQTPKSVFLLPAILIVLFMSVFPLIVSLFLSFARVDLARGGFQVQFVGLRNYEKLLLGSGQRHVLGAFGEISPAGWGICFIVIGLTAFWLYRYISNPDRRFMGVFFRLLGAVFTVGLVVLVVSTLIGEGIPGTLVVTLIFVFIGVFFQYIIGLLLALLVTQEIPGKRIFRVIFLLPMMITPVGIGFLFRMLTDTFKGPFAPLWTALGLSNTSWVETAAGARTAVLIGDIWQWTPFMFIILLAALEGTSREQIEAALVDGANRLHMFRYIVMPQIAPVSMTVILVRLIEAFKIIDMPRILTGGGPGTATESLTLHAYNEWKSPNLGGSAALSYLLLIVVTFVALMFVNVVRRWILEKI